MRSIDIDTLLERLDALQTRHTVNGFAYKRKFIAFNDIYSLIETIWAENQPGQQEVGDED